MYNLETKLLFISTRPFRPMMIAMLQLAGGSDFAFLFVKWLRLRLVVNFDTFVHQSIAFACLLDCRLDNRIYRLIGLGVNRNCAVSKNSPSFAKCTEKRKKVGKSC